MTFFPEGTRSPFARAVSAEVRARMAAQRITGRELAATAGFSSHNYLAIRLRDEKPFTLDDVDRICAVFDEDAPDFLQAASDHHEERLWAEASAAAKAREAEVLEIPARSSDPRLDRNFQPGEGMEVTGHVRGRFRQSAEEREAEQAVEQINRHTRDTRPARKRAMQQLDDQAARDEDSRA